MLNVSKGAEKGKFISFPWSPPRDQQEAWDNWESSSSSWQSSSLILALGITTNPFNLIFTAPDWGETHSVIFKLTIVGASVYT